MDRLGLRKIQDRLGCKSAVKTAEHPSPLLALERERAVPTLPAPPLWGRVGVGGDDMRDASDTGPPPSRGRGEEEREEDL